MSPKPLALYAARTFHPNKKSQHSLLFTTEEGHVLVFNPETQVWKARDHEHHPDKRLATLAKLGHRSSCGCFKFLRLWNKLVKGQPDDAITVKTITVQRDDAAAERVLRISYLLDGERETALLRGPPTAMYEIGVIFKANRVYYQWIRS